jgi:hypothetical protein
VEIGGVIEEAHLGVLGAETVEMPSEPAEHVVGSGVEAAGAFDDRCRVDEGQR